MSIADLHIHSRYSDGRDEVRAILDAAIANGVDLIAITDHDRIDGAREAAAIATGEGLPLTLVIGEEITTRHGHLLGLGLTDVVPAGLSMRDAIRHVHDQGGLAICSHPLAPHRHCASAAVIRRLVDEGDAPDALEHYNPTPGARLVRGRIARLAAELGLALVGNSDAHRAEHVGMARTIYPGDGYRGLRTAIAERATVGSGRDLSLVGLARIFVIDRLWERRRAASVDEL